MFSEISLHSWTTAACFCAFAITVQWVWLPVAWGPHLNPEIDLGWPENVQSLCLCWWKGGMMQEDNLRLAKERQMNTQKLFFAEDIRKAQNRRKNSSICFSSFEDVLKVKIRKKNNLTFKQNGSCVLIGSLLTNYKEAQYGVAELYWALSCICSYIQAHVKDSIYILWLGWFSHCFEGAFFSFQSKKCTPPRLLTDLIAFCWQILSVHSRVIQLNRVQITLMNHNPR